MYPNEFAARKVKTHLKYSHCSVFFSRASISFILHIKHQTLLFTNWKPTGINRVNMPEFPTYFQCKLKKKSPVYSTHSTLTKTGCHHEDSNRHKWYIS